MKRDNSIGVQTQELEKGQKGEKIISPGWDHDIHKVAEDHLVPQPRGRYNTYESEWPR